MTYLLAGGLWMPPSIWDPIVPRLEGAVPVTLPGQGDGNTAARLEDQVAAVVAAVDAATDRVVVVGHSAACSLAWLAADRRPARVAAVALIGGLLPDNGQKYADLFPIADGLMPFPGWEPFEGPDSDDLSPAQRAALAEAAIAVPEGVARGVVRLTDERRFDVPVAAICPEFTPAQAREWIEAGDTPETALAKHLDLIDIDSGHWPMVTKPAELAAILAAI
ncbi:alpha/beta fold hydrolase [Actinoplanes sp. NPDC051343]|uniref:alpha/beta fold hydrolase n=1 Tax=Actinoplanes sp. NPDC051343 TaxID=3363906 RepID=UPI0037A61871